MVARNLLLSTVVALIPSVFASPANPQVTTPARLEVRATSTSPNFIGYVSAFGAYSPYSCGTAARWTTVANYGKCCSTQYNNCDFATACKSGSIVMYTDTSVTCTSSDAPACIVDWVVNDLSDQKTISWVGCDISRAGSVYVRATTSASPTTSPTTPAGSPATPTTTITPISPPSSATTAPAGPTPAKKSNVGVIAGAAVGGLAVLALLAGLLVWIILLNKKNKTNKANAAVAGASDPNNGQPPVQYQQQPMQQQQQYNAGYMSPDQQRASMFQPGSPPPVYPQEYKAPIVTSSEAVGSNQGFGQQQYQPQGVSPITPAGGYQPSQPQMNREMAPPMNGAHEMPGTNQ